MTLDQLRVFVAVAERSHVTRAARVLGMTQSAASAAIAALERQAGIRLFDRIGRGIQLTETGRRFLPEARNLLEVAKFTHTRLGQSAGIAQGTVSVAASQTIANHWLPRRLAACHRAYPDIRFDIAMGNTRSVENAVVEGEADFGLVEGPTSSDLLIRRVVDVDRPVLVVSAESYLPRSGKRVELTELPWIVREQGSGTRHVLEELCEQMNVPFDTLRIALVLPSNEAVREAVEAGAGAAVMSNQVVSGAIEAGRLRSVPVDLPEREFVLVRHSQRSQSPAQRALGKVLSNG